MNKLELCDEGISNPAFRVFYYLDINPISNRRKRRKLSDPNIDMRIIHTRIISYLKGLRKFSWMFKKRKSVYRNIIFHLRNRSRYFFLLDLSDAFGHVRSIELSKIITESDPELNSDDFKSIYDLLRRYCINQEDGLIIGAPASNALFEIYAHIKLDPVLKNLSDRYSLFITRYVDDIVISSKYPIGQRKRKAILLDIRNTDLAINNEKCEVLDLAKGPIIMNGIGIKPNGSTFISRSEITKRKRIIYSALKQNQPNDPLINGLMGTVVEYMGRRPPKSRLEKELFNLYKKYRYWQYLRSKIRK